jgi:signal transduction histidine kinase
VAIELEVRQLTSEGWDVTYEQNLGHERLAPVVETALFRVTQEALTNVRSHADTRRIAVSIDRQARLIRLAIRDWGRGFRPAALPRATGPAERVGLAGMQDRISLLRGRCTIQSRPGVGTRIVAEVPLPARASRAQV